MEKKKEEGKKKDLKSLYQRFRAWQLQPFKHKDVSGKQRKCFNCGHEYEGKFCPVCGQKFDEGPVDWSSVLGDLKDMLNIKDPRGLLPFVVQLFGRTGYVISDYIAGRQKVCRSPVSSMIGLALCAMLVQGSTEHTPTYQHLFQGGELSFMGGAMNWLSSNLSWAVLIQTLLLVFPTWLLFRYAPRHTRHTIPQGLYIQVFMTSIVLFSVMIRCLVGDVALLIIPIFYYVAYRTLFGYSVWGTLWRTLLCMGSILYLIAILMTAATSPRLAEISTTHSVWASIGIIASYLLLGVGVMALCWWIGLVQSKKKQ